MQLGKLLTASLLVIAMTMPMFSMDVGSQSQGNVVINEFLPWPASGEEYIELYNTGDVAVNIAGWTLDDVEGGGGHPYLLSGEILPGEHLVFWGNITGIRLNNDGDTARLLDVDGAVVDSHVYGFADPGAPSARLPDGGGWYVPLQTSPGDSNGAIPASPVKEVLFSSLLPVCTGKWEFLSIVNHDRAMDLEGWRISDGEGCWRLDTYTLDTGEECIIAANATNYHAETGTMPDMVPQGEITMGDSKEGVFLFDPWGRLADAIWYGDIVPTMGWIGDPAPYPWAGGVMHRKGDTNTSVDWDPMWITPVGATNIEGIEYGVDQATFFALPDAGTTPIIEFIDSAQTTLDINVYQFTHQNLADAVVAACERGVAVRLLMEGTPVSWNWTIVSEDEASDVHREAYTELHIASRIEAAGGEVRFIASDGTVDSRITRYRYDHAKYAIVDGAKLLLTTENWKTSGIPVQGEKGNRGWGVIVSSSQVSSQALDVFEDDWTGLGDAVAYGHNPYNAPPTWFTPTQYSSTPRPTHFSPLEAEDCSVRLIIGPEDNMRDDTVIGAIENASNSIYLELLDLNLDWYVCGQRFSSPLIDALVDAAHRGVDVRILLDSRYGDGIGGDEDNQDVALWLNQLAQEEDISLEARMVDLDATSLDKVHSKTMVIDSEIVLISSMNWNANSVLRNREMGLLVESQEAAVYHEEVFLWDWSSATIETDTDQELDEPIPMIWIGVGIAGLLCLLALWKKFS